MSDSTPVSDPASGAAAAESPNDLGRSLRRGLVWIVVAVLLHFAGTELARWTASGDLRQATNSISGMLLPILQLIGKVLGATLCLIGTHLLAAAAAAVGLAHWLHAAVLAWRSRRRSA